MARCLNHLLLLFCFSFINRFPESETRSLRVDKERGLSDLLPSWILRQFGGSPSNKDDTQDSVVPLPKEVLNWPSENLVVGQIAGVAVDENSNPVIFHRGSTVWQGNSFDGNNQYQFVSNGPIKEPTLVRLDSQTGKVLEQWGENLFYMPHGLEIDGDGNLWVTDVALHQVLKIPKGTNKPSLILGQAFQPGYDDKHFCKPTDVAVSSNGIFFVADGYCNNRILKYSPDGTLLDVYKGQFAIPHSLALLEEEDALCVADRENRRVTCLSAGLKENNGVSSKFGQHRSSSKQGIVGRVFAVTGKGDTVYGVTGPTFPFQKPDGFTFDINRAVVTSKWSTSRNFGNPHDIEISRDGSTLYTAEIGPNRVTKFALS